MSKHRQIFIFSIKKNVPYYLDLFKNNTSLNFYHFPHIDVDCFSALFFHLFLFRLLPFWLRYTGDQHEYCKSDNSDSNQATENSSARKNTFQTQQTGSDFNTVAANQKRKQENHPNGHSESPTSNLIQQVSKQINNSSSSNNSSRGNSPNEHETKAKQQQQQQQTASSPSPDTTISVGSSASTAIRAESNFDANFTNDDYDAAAANDADTAAQQTKQQHHKQQQQQQSVTVEKPITAGLSAVTAPLTSSKLENNNNNRNISDLV